MLKRIAVILSLVCFSLSVKAQVSDQDCKNLKKAAIMFKNALEIDHSEVDYYMDHSQDWDNDFIPAEVFQRLLYDAYIGVPHEAINLLLALDYDFGLPEHLVDMILYIDHLDHVEELTISDMFHHKIYYLDKFLEPYKEYPLVCGDN
ncbi:MAG: hypothetical protein CME71_02035 [Halobacteriovorax sp.]|nr:hypothetical protein [Halobacteriovorax sp.]